MKKLISALILFAGLPAIASAHTLADDEGLLVQLQHQLLGSHHLPLLLLVVAAALAVRYWRKRPLR